MHDEILLCALPVFIACMALEWAWGRWHGRTTGYALGDTLSSLGQGLLSQGVALATPLLQTGLYALVQARLHLMPASFWATSWGWVLAVVCYDFSDYWLHRISHENALFWAAHAVHHQSEHFNLSTALRQESFYAVMGCPFFLPMALLGFSPEQFLVAGTVVLFYQFWIHTEHIGRLGWLDRVFSTPSNHRVHHAVNPQYLDRNYGAILVVWDRLFGSFAEETEPCVYGTVKPLASWNPLRGVAQFYVELGRRVALTPAWSDKLRVLFKSPGWLPPGVPPDPVPPAARLAQPRHAPPLTPAARRRAVAVFLACAAAMTAWLLRSDALPYTRQLLALALLASALGCMGRTLESPADTPGRAARRRRPWTAMLGLMLAGMLAAAVIA